MGLIYKSGGVQLTRLDLLFLLYVDVIGVGIFLLFKFFFDERRK